MASGDEEYFAHESDDGRRETVGTHLDEVAAMAAEFAAAFSTEDDSSEELVRLLGLAHDAGKFSHAFQRRLLEQGDKVDHATAGALMLWNLGEDLENHHEVGLWLQLLAYCAAGHHGGLPDGGAVAAAFGHTLMARLARARKGHIPPFDAFKRQRPPLAESVPGWPEPFLDTDPAPRGVVGDYFAPFTQAFWTRMVFSCLVDADFLCTERFMKGAGRSQPYESLEALIERLERHLDGLCARKPAEGKAAELASLRREVSNAARDAAQLAPGIFTLTVPTGGGKTLASLRFALHHAVAHGKQRVIYAIPYTSIIDQNARVFREALGASNVLEHHSNFDFDSLEDPDTPGSSEQAERLRLASENWDAPVVATTTVQLFESLFSNKPSKARKLHNIASSVIVLDEAQSLPLQQLAPAMAALEELVRRYGCTVVFCTATQPGFHALMEGHRIGPVREIAPNVDCLFTELRRVSYQWLDLLEDDELAERLADEHQALCIVNSKKQARAVFELLKGREGVFHLSTNMHLHDRERVLKEVRRRLKDDEPCTLVSTSLVEAGVDVDFPVVYRALAGLDSVVQAAGRCNREGRRSVEESVVYLFEPAAGYKIPEETRNREGLSRVQRALEGRVPGGQLPDLGSPEVLRRFFSALLGQGAGDWRALDKKGILRLIDGATVDSMPFETVAREFSLIDGPTDTVVIPCEDNQKDLEALLSGGGDRALLRRLGRWSVSLWPNQRAALANAGALTPVGDGLFVLDDPSLYHGDVGLVFEEAGGRGQFL